jgi:hypothetical protein
MGDHSDASERPRATGAVSPRAIVLDDESDTIYQPPANRVVAPPPDAISEQPTQPDRPKGRFAAIVRLIVPHRRRAN